MAPKRKAGDVPKAVAGLRAKLAERNMEVTSENLRTLQKEMGQGILKAGFTNLSESLTAIGKGSEYKDLRGDAAKREHLARYIMDPDKVLGTFTTTVSAETNDLYQELWLTEEQLEDELKSKKNAEIKISKAEKRLHDDPDLAAGGVHVYQYWRKRTDHSAKTKQAASVTKEASLTAEQGDLVAADMIRSLKRKRSNSAVPEPIKKKAVKIKNEPAEKGEMTAEEAAEAREAKLLADASKDFVNKVNEVKKLKDKLHRELGEVALVEKNWRRKKIVGAMARFFSSRRKPKSK